jgi:hypothetical protein
MIRAQKVVRVEERVKKEQREKRGINKLKVRRMMTMIIRAEEGQNQKKGERRNRANRRGKARKK